MSEKISIIILVHNVEEELEPALVSSQFADEIIVVDTNQGSTDNTLTIAKKYKAKIVKSPGDSFSKWRNDGAKYAKGDWLLYLDSDERIPVKLAEEIQKTISNSRYQAYTISRFEVFLGKHLSHWGDSRVIRLIEKKSLKKWQGKVHEQPIVTGNIGNLKQQMVHLSHKNIDEKVTSTMNWSKIEAQNMFDVGHPQMVGWRFIRVMFTEFIDRYFKRGLYRDGTEGMIESIYQMFSKFMSYERLWELQRKPSLKETYKNIDKQILDEWSAK